MTIIGILASGREHKIEAMLKKMFETNQKRVAWVRDLKILEDELYSLKSIGTDYCIITFRPGRIRPHFVDILILDVRATELRYDLLKCISPDTRLLYNADRRNMPRINHPNAIDYGFSTDAAVTLSSLGGDDSFVFCIQRPLRTLFDAPMEEGEVLVKSAGRDLSSLLAAVACGFLCGIFRESRIKI